MQAGCRQGREQRSHTSSTESKTTFIPLMRILISSRTNVTEVFLHTIGISEITVLFPTVSYDTFSHLLPRCIHRQGTHKKFAQHIHRRGRDNGNFPQIKSHSRYKLKHTQFPSHNLILPALDYSPRQPLNVSVSSLTRHDRLCNPSWSSSRALARASMRSQCR